MAKLKKAWLLPILFLPLGCLGEKNLLDVPVKNPSSINPQEYNTRLQEVETRPSFKENLHGLLSHLFSLEKAANSLILLNRSADKKEIVYQATLILEGPGDDSVAGYRYDLKLKKKNLSGSQSGAKDWEIQEIEKTWRCWEGRGHIDFSSEPCT